MDLPKKVLSGGATSVEYSYLSDGTRTAALGADGEGLVYRGQFTYRRSASGALTLEAAACPEGLLTDGEVLLHVTDHLGSTMAVMRGSDGALYEASEYDAYGKRSSLTVSGAAALPDGVTLRSGFTGKEDQAPDFGIGYTDFGARLYSPASRRWMVPDPLSEKYYGISPYAYCAGNPVNFVDPDGRDIWEIDMTGRILNRKKDETQDVFHIVNQGIETTNTTLSFGYHTFSEIDGIFSSVNGKMSLDLFCFLSSNTSVEYGLIATDESLYSIFTDHHHDRIDITTVGNVLQKSGHTINTMIHSHPENKYPSGYGNQCIGDRLVTVLFDDPFTKQIDHFVYYPKYNSVMQFDKNGIIDFVVPMETAFPHFF